MSSSKSRFKKTLTIALIVITLQVTISCKQQDIESIDFDIYVTPEEKAQILAAQFPGLSVSVMHNNQAIWNWSGGYADIENQTLATPDTLFNIYSVSKMITGMAFLRLHNDGHLVTETKIRTIDAILPKHYDEITVAHLLDHRSGIRHYNRGNDWKKFSERRCNTTKDAIDYFSNDSLKFRPGAEELYSTFGMALASHVLVKATGASGFAEAVNAQLHTDDPFILDGASVQKATSYISEGKRFERIDNINAECKFAGGGFIASSKQLAIAGAKLAHGEIVPTGELKKLLIEDKPEGAQFSFAMSTNTAPQLGGAYAVMRGGASGGRGMLLVLLDAQMSIAVVGNAEGESDDVSAFAISLAEYFLSRGSDESRL